MAASLIERQLAEQIGATGSIEFGESGVAVTLELPMSTDLVLLPDAPEPNRRG